MVILILTFLFFAVVYVFTSIDTYVYMYMYSSIPVHGALGEGSLAGGPAARRAAPCRYGRFGRPRLCSLAALSPRLMSGVRGPYRAPVNGVSVPLMGLTIRWFNRSKHWEFI